MPSNRTDAAASPRAAAAPAASVTALALAAAAMLSGTLLVFQPASIYAGNAAFFSLPYRQLLLVLLPAWVLATVLAAWPARVGPPVWRQSWALLLAALATLAWITGSILYDGHGLVDGRSLGIEAGARLDARTVAAFGAAATLTAMAYRWPRRIAQFLALMVVLSLATAGLTAVRDTAPWRSAPDWSELTRFSPERNVLLILLDTFQSDFLEPILESEPGLRTQFDGFVAFRQASGVAPTTYLSLPAIHSGQVYDPGTRLDAYYDRSVVEGSFLTRLGESGYRSLLLNPIWNKCPRGVDCFSDDLLVNGVVRGSLQSGALLLDLSLLRSTPAPLRPRVYNRGLFVLTALIDPLAFFVRSNELLRELARRMTVSGPPTLKFLHLFSTHPPARIRADCRVEAPREWNRANALEHDLCAIRRVAELLAQLRRNRVFDDTVIAVFADHGAGLPEGTTTALQANAAPLLLVKAPRARGALQVSERAASLADLPATVCAATRACQWPVGRDLLSTAEQPASPNVFNQYEWRHEYWYESSIPIEARYAIDGSPWDALAWRWAGGPTSSLALPRVRSIRFGADDDPRHFGPGWWSAERSPDGTGFRWVVGRVASLYLQPPPDWTGHLELNGFTHAGNDRQTIELLVDGRTVWSGPFQPLLQVSLEAALKPSGPFTLGLRMAQDEPPAPGARRLSVALDALTLR